MEEIDLKISLIINQVSTYLLLLR